MSDRVVLVTGASGFVGRVVCNTLAARGWTVRATGHRNAAAGVHSIPVGPATDWSGIIEGCHAVVHLAGRAHVLRESSKDPLATYREINTEGSKTLAEAAAAFGVPRLVFLSSVAVHGSTEGVIQETTPLRACTPYGVSKLEAEVALRRVAEQTGLEVTILRAPLVYGPGVGARFLHLLRWSRRGLPLPFGAVRNERSFISVYNLADAISIGLEHPMAANREYLVADSEVVSTPELISQLAGAMGRPAYLFPVQVALLRLVAQWSGMQSELERLIGSLVVDTRRIREELAWIPPFPLAAGLAETAAWYVANS